MKRADVSLLARGYASEIVFGLATLAAVLFLFRAATVADALHAVAGKLAIVTGGLAAASFGTLSIYFGQTSSEFGKYLSWRGVSTAYLVAFGVAAIYQVVCTVCLVFMTAFRSDILSAFCVFMLAMSLANVVSMITNLVSVIRLRDRFNDERDRLMDQERKSR